MIDLRINFKTLQVQGNCYELIECDAIYLGNYAE